MSSINPHIDAMSASSDVLAFPAQASQLDLGDSRDLKSAFEVFNKMSQQLAESYTHLEDRVADLNRELNTVSDQRYHELAEKERLANRLETLLNVLPGGVVVIDAKGIVSESNPTAKEMLGEPLQGVYWRHVIERCFAPRSDDGHEISTRDGRFISMATSSLGDDGQIILLTDQTETRRLQAELSHHERLSSLGQMVSALAHQIRTPLSTAMLYAGHLCSDELAEDKRKTFSNKLLGRLNHMEQQVQDMLLFVKGDIILNDLMAVKDIQQALADELEVPVATASAKVSWSVDGVDEKVHCNLDALISALMNLVNNAIQAVPDTARLNIRMTIIEQQLLAISVIDNGPGIAADKLASVQEVFVTTKPQGTGLGLAVVDAVARGHKGKFILRSEEGKGTAATVVLPLFNQMNLAD